MPRPAGSEQTTEFEAELVRQWREDCLFEAGVPREDAHMLSLSDADLHKMLDAIKDGCDVRLLLQIFA